MGRFADKRLKRLGRTARSYGRRLQEYETDRCSVTGIRDLEKRKQQEMLLDQRAVELRRARESLLASARSLGAGVRLREVT